MTPKTLVLTGATGFVGRCLLKRSLQTGWRVRALVRNPEHLDRFNIDNSDLTVEPLDLPNTLPDPAVFAGAHAIIHAAAYIPEDYEQSALARACFEINVLGTITILEAALEASVPRVVAFSSGNAYRTAPGARTEDDPLFPNRRAGYYLASKAAGDMLTDYYHHAKGLSVATLRVASVYGPGMAPGSFLPLCLDRLRNSAPIELSQAGLPTTDWVYVDDVAEAALQVALSDVTGPFNIGAGEAPSLRTAAELAARLLGADRNLIQLKPKDPAASNALGFRPLDITKAKRAFGYAPRPLESGLRSWLDRS